MKYLLIAFSGIGTWIDSLTPGDEIVVPLPEPKIITVKFTAPTQNIKGAPIIKILHYEVWTRGAESNITIPGDVTSYSWEVSEYPACSDIQLKTVTAVGTSALSVPGHCL